MNATIALLACRAMLVDVAFGVAVHRSHSCIEVWVASHQVELDSGWVGRKGQTLAPPPRAPSKVNCYKHLQLALPCPPRSSKSQPGPAALPIAHPELSRAACVLFKLFPRNCNSPPPPPLCSAHSAWAGPAGTRAASIPLLPAGACALGPSRIWAGGGGSREKGALRGGKGPNPEITRMWSPRAHAQCPSDKLAATTRPWSSSPLR